MSAELERFRELVLADPALQAELRADTDERSFVRLMVQRAAREGIALDEEQVRAALNAARRAWIERDL